MMPGDAPNIGMHAAGAAVKTFRVANPHVADKRYTPGDARYRLPAHTFDQVHWVGGAATVHTILYG